MGTKKVLSLEDLSVLLFSRRKGGTKGQNNPLLGNEIWVVEGEMR